MALKVNPNRMELLRLRRRLALARRGHDLLKDKQEELVRRLLALAADLKKRRGEVEKEVVDGQRRLMRAVGLMASQESWDAVFGSAARASLVKATETILNFTVPKLTVSIDTAGDDPTAGPPELASLRDEKETLLSAVLELAARERWIEILAEELIKTRRRVNALEHVVIPDLEQAIRGISMKLTEQERSTIVRLMKIKEILEASARVGTTPNIYKNH